MYTWHKGDKRSGALWARFWMWLAWRLPKRLVYWAAIRLLSAATVGKYSNTVVPELRAMDALERWEE